MHTWAALLPHNCLFNHLCQQTTSAAKGESGFSLIPKPPLSKGTTHPSQEIAPHLVLQIFTFLNSWKTASPPILQPYETTMPKLS